MATRTKKTVPAPEPIKVTVGGRYSTDLAEINEDHDGDWDLTFKDTCSNFCITSEELRHLYEILKIHFNNNE